jgi:hypothetical protein
MPKGLKRKLFITAPYFMCIYVNFILGEDAFTEMNELSKPKSIQLIFIIRVSTPIIFQLDSLPRLLLRAVE